ncbi:hypothetical protein HMPREF1991_01378 [Hoylesella loescheii DSM 19665 = JCM 12249 = ATCC 15930]|uniref:Uncharacterized protein n=1 Tax=Hoylesella loescheii DSM 19665 = JCM 12249 = ATCC 15930 TaxID=1122985 RepID=A0A069QRR7_HOYLO|nr:hypothetical protein HMPREF1991_01378 [Hoylesella loescheii DSM 19665 = JCM 12249 = ATCC 15930]
MLTRQLKKATPQPYKWDVASNTIISSVLSSTISYLEFKYQQT